MSKTPHTTDEEADGVPQVHRNAALDEEGISQAVVDDFIHHQLPFLLQVKAEMDAGKTLTDAELDLLTRLVERAHNINAFTYLHPELKELVAKGIDLVHEITAAALRNASDAKQPE